MFSTSQPRSARVSSPLRSRKLRAFVEGENLKRRS